MTIYDHRKIERRWQKRWQEVGIYEPFSLAPDFAEATPGRQGKPDLRRAKRPHSAPSTALRASRGEPFYNLMMFPYPSAEGLHVGNMYAFTGADVYGRFKRMQGFDVFEPIGLDGFGIHSENYAIQVGRHPAEQAKISEKRFYEQLAKIGNGFAWKERLETYDPEYYRWTQWLFVQMFKRGLAVRKQASVNWCPSCKTVLADEQAEGGVCERCGTPVERRSLAQWFFRITEYADRLLRNIDGEIPQHSGSSRSARNERDDKAGVNSVPALSKAEKKDQFGPVPKDYDPAIDGLCWPEKIKTAQRNWIGKSEGAEVGWKVVGSESVIRTFTTRLDTIYGATFLVLAPEHETVAKLLSSKLPFDKAQDRQVQSAKLAEIRAYVEAALKKTEQKRKAAEREKTGIDTGLRVIHPLSGEQIPVWVADFVLMDYGTGAIMGVPAHDERDFAFAKKYHLPVKKVIDWQDEFHSLVIKRSVADKFIREVERLGWQWSEYEGWGYRIVGPREAGEEYIRLVQRYLTQGPWYVDADGSLKVIIFKDKVFPLPLEEKAAKDHARSLSIPEEQLDWQQPGTYSYCYTRYGKVVNSGEFDGLQSEAAMERILGLLQKEGQGAKKVTFHLRDWLISRQRYWGPPIPMVYCQSCANAERGWITENAKRKAQSAKRQRKTQNSQEQDWWHNGWWPVPEEELPVLLPPMSHEDVRPTGDGRAPLEKAPEGWLYTKCPGCGGRAKRETDVSDTFLDSSWYFLRYPSAAKSQRSKVKSQKSNATRNTQELPWDTEITKKWLPVDAYIGGAEHAVLHLLYSRFVTMALHDWGYLPFEEPFPFLYSHGLIIKDGAKMSKSRGNVVVPDDYITKFGSDTLRIYLMFLGRYDQGGDFRDTGIAGMYRFLNRVWRLYQKWIPQRSGSSHPARSARDDTADIKSVSAVSKVREKTNSNLVELLHKTIQKVTEDIERFRFNTAIALLMEFVNAWELAAAETAGGEERRRVSVSPKIAENFLKLLAPFAPHLSEELYSQIAANDPKQGGWSSIHTSRWPEAEARYLTDEVVEVVIQVNGKLRGRLDLEASLARDQEAVETRAKLIPGVARQLAGKSIKKTVWIAGKLINFVV